MNIRDKPKLSWTESVGESLVNQRDEMVNLSDNIATHGGSDLCHFQFSPNFLLVLLQRGLGPQTSLAEMF